MVHDTYVTFSSVRVLKQGHTPFMIKFGYTESGHNVYIANSSEGHCSPFITLYLLHLENSKTCSFSNKIAFIGT